MRLSKSDFQAIKKKSAARNKRRLNNAFFNALIADAVSGQKKPQKTLRSISKTHAELEEKRWTFFSLLIRRRDIKLYEGRCFFCEIRPIQDAAHIISRRKLATKYHLDAVHGSCKKCNWMDRYVPGYHDYCVSVFIAKFGPEKYKFLVDLSNTELHETKADIVGATEKYKKQLEAGII